MERCVVAPTLATIDILDVAAHLAFNAIAREGDQKGDVIVFLPGLQEILQVQMLLKQRLPNLTIWLLHSDIVGNEDETEIVLPDSDNERVVALSTIIGARSITFDKMRYAIVHPAIRVEVLLSSGYSGLCMEPLSSELEGNMCGRVARLCSGLATLLYHPDDTALALSSMPPDFRPQAMEDKTMWVTLVVGSPSRFYCVQHTCRHLMKCGVPNIYLLSTPGATELDQLNYDPKKRVMMFWYATVLPALLFLETHHGIKRAFVVEDTCLLAPGVTFQDVDEATWSLFKMSMRQHGQKGRIPRHASLYATSFSILACLVVCIPSQGHG
jgi:hypothetical protein